jgi:hypothetical protein
MIQKINWLYGAGSIDQDLPAIFAEFLNETQGERCDIGQHGKRHRPETRLTKAPKLP